MTELLITPNFDKKTAKAKGAVAAGEHISVTIENASDIDTASLRLRVISLSGKTLAMFQSTLEPDEDGQTYAWGFAGNEGISCELNLNTVQMQESVCGMCETDFELVLDDPKAHTLYFKGLLSVQGWPKKEGAEAPYDLDDFPALIDDWTKQLDNMEVSAKRVDGSVEIVAWDGKGKKPDGVVVKDGPKGDKGDTGDKGNGITKIEFARKNADGDNIYEVTMDDGTTHEVVMPKGPKGDSGGVEKEEFDAEVKRATDRENEIDNKVKTLVGITEGDGNKSVRRIAREEVGRVVDGAPEAFDTLKEISKYIEEDQTVASAMVKAIADNRASIDNEISRSTQADNALAARTKTLENISAETAKILTNKADTTAVAKALETKANKEDIPSLSGYATEKYVDEAVKKAGGGDAVAVKFHALAPETSEGKVTLKPVDGKANWVDGTVGVGTAKGPGITFSLECWLEVNTMDEGGDPMTIEKYFEGQGLVFDEEELIITDWGHFRDGPDTTLISLKLSKDKQVVFGNGPYMVVCTIPAGDTFSLWTFEGWIEPGYAYSDYLSFSSDRETLFSEAKLYRSEEDLVSTADSIYFEQITAVVRSTSGSSTPVHITLPASTGPARSFSLALTTDAKGETEVTWEGADNVIEAFSGAKKLAPGTTVWDVKEVMPNTFLVDRAPTTSGVAITGDDGNAYTLGVDSEGTLEVRL